MYGEEAGVGGPIRVKGQENWENYFLGELLFGDELLEEWVAFCG